MSGLAPFLFGMSTGFFCCVSIYEIMRWERARMTTQPTSEMIEAVADALARLPCRDMQGVCGGEHELDILRRREAAKAAIAAMGEFTGSGGEGE